jgi:ABC-type polysaccharide/polyol phosphate export permease
MQTNADDLWIWVRMGGFSLLIAILLSGAMWIIIEYKRFKPYFQKFNRFKPLLGQLIQRDFKSKYKRSVLGVLWTVLNPLLSMLILTIVFSTIFRFDIPNFPVYLLSGQIAFGFFSEVTNTALMSIVSNANLIKKVSLPKYIFPTAKAVSGGINMLFSMLALLLIMFITKSSFCWTILLTPIALVYLFVFSLGVGLVLSVSMVFFRDTLYLYGILLMAITYLTSLFYPISIIPEKYQFLISLNPMFHFVEYFRCVTIYATVPSLWQNVVCILLAMNSLLLGLIVFYKAQDKFILYI